MEQVRAVSGGAINLALLQDFALGNATVSPSTRSISGPAGTAVVEPRMMQVLVAMAAQAGRLVTRNDLLERCWGGAPVGDDSLNRAVAGLRRAFCDAANDLVRVETVAGSGYMLTIARNASQAGTAGGANVAGAIEAGWQSWKLGLPQPDPVALDQLRWAVAAQPERADVHGMLALLLRQAAEYADLALCPALVSECETAAAHALALDPSQPHARAALIGLPPLFGDWIARRRALTAALEEAPGNFVAAHDLCMLEMATGRTRAAEALSARLIDEEPLAATLHYKRVYQLWATGKLADMDRIADRGMQLWPRHPAIWFARLWSLAFTERPRQAAQQLRETSARPDLPEPVLATLQRTLTALAEPDDAAARDAAIEDNLRIAERGPAQSLGAIIQLAGLGAVDAAFSVAEGYLLRRGPVSVSVHKSSDDPSVTDQHRRVTQMLFLPVTARLRENARFLTLCRDMGLGDYWEAAKVTPDFLGGGPEQIARPKHVEPNP